MARSGLRVFSFFWVLLIWELAIAAPASLTYQGRIVKSDGTPLNSPNVSFLFEITNSSGTCVLYREQVNGINMVNSDGVFDVKIGASRSYPSTPGFTILDSFNNSTPLVCDGGVAFTPTDSSERLLRVQFYDGTNWRVISPDSVIRSVPYAAYSESALKLGANYAEDFVLKNSVNGNNSCGGGSFLTWNAGTQSFGCAAAPSGGGSGSVTEVTSANPYLTVANENTTPLLTLNVGQLANTVAAGNDPRFTNARVPTGSASGDLSGNYPGPTVSRIQGIGVDFSLAPTTGQVLTYDGANWISQSLPSASSGTVTSIATGTGLSGGPISNTGTIELGAPLLGLHNIATTGFIRRTGPGAYSTLAGSASASTNNLVMRDGSGVSSFYGVGIAGATSGEIFLQAPGIATTYSLTLPDQQGGANQVMINDGGGVLSWANMPVAPGAACTTGNVLSYNGSAFVCVPDQVGSAGGGIASLNNQTGSSQSFANGTTGNLPNWNSAGDVHTLNIPFARTGSVSAGLISKTEYDTFNSKQAALGFTPLNPANNLSELTSTASTARGNLGLGSASVKEAPSAGVNATTSQVVIGDDSRLTNSRAPSGNAGGDLASIYPNPEVARIKGISLAYTSLTSGQFLKYNGTSWINSGLGTSDISGLSTALGSKIDQSQIVGTCSAGSTLVFSSVSGNWTCTSIAISDAQLTHTSKAANTFLAAPSTGAGVPTYRKIASADLPTSVTDGLWEASGGNVSRGSGRVGIGTSSPTDSLHVAAGNIRVANNAGIGANFAASSTHALFPYLQGMNAKAGLGPLLPHDEAMYLVSDQAIAFGETDNNTVVGYMNVNNRTFTWDGDLGVGTLVPDSPLHIYRGTGHVSSKVQAGAGGVSAVLDRPAGQFGYVRVSTNNVARWDYGATNEAETGSNVGSNFYVRRFNDAGTMLSNALTISRNSGYVGVNTQTPLSGLHIVGTGGSNDDIVVDSYTSSTEGALIFRKAYGTEAAPSSITATASLGKISFRGHDGTSFQDVASIQAYSKGAMTSTDSLLVFRTASGTSAATESMRITELGNVGIANTAANSTLSVAHNGAASWRVAIGGLGTTSGTYGLVLRDSANVNTFWVRDDGAVHVADRMAIGAAPDANYALRTAGNLYVAGSGGNCIIGNATGGVTCTSDARLKENVLSIPDSLEKILQVRGVTYDWNKASGREGQHAMGVIAQEVEAVFPELVHKEPTSGYRTVDYGGLVAPMIEAIKELYGKVTGVDQRVTRELASVKEELAEQKKLNESLIKRLEALEKKQR